MHMKTLKMILNDVGMRKSTCEEEVRHGASMKVIKKLQRFSSHLGAALDDVESEPLLPRSLQGFLDTSPYCQHFARRRPLEHHD